jgi:hypothetical protein
MGAISRKRPVFLAFQEPGSSGALYFLGIEQVFAADFGQVVALKEMEP